MLYMLCMGWNFPCKSKTFLIMLMIFYFRCVNKIVILRKFFLIQLLVLEYAFTTSTTCTSSLDASSSLDAWSSASPCVGATAGPPASAMLPSSIPKCSVESDNACSAPRSLRHTRCAALAHHLAHELQVGAGAVAVKVS
jgi:hypothetical protein